MTTTTTSFLRHDYKKGFFPLSSNLFYCEHGETEINDLIQNYILNNSYTDHSFLRAPVNYALKDSNHIRRVVQLDPVSTYFLYNFVNTNRTQFKKPRIRNRTMYGFAFESGDPLPSFSEYHNFRKRKYELKEKYEYFIKVDIANCFNSFYHHDITSYLKSSLGDQAGDHMGQFLREINGGISVNFFPQGIFPAKTIGNFFLSFVEASRELRSDEIIRFLDDIYLFSNDLQKLENDMFTLQYLLADKGLFLNAQKTIIGSKSSDMDERELDEIKIALLHKRQIEEDSDRDDEFDEDEDDEDDEDMELTNEEREYLYDLVKSQNEEEEDVELALVLLKDDPNITETLADKVVNGYPSLLRNLYKLFKHVITPSKYAYLFNDKLKKDHILEYELFWMTRIILDHYPWNTWKADTLMDIYNHRSVTPIIKAAILEDTQSKFGFSELKEAVIKNDGSGTTTFAALAGIRDLERGKRNQHYKYAAKQGPIMKVLCHICSKA